MNAKLSLSILSLALLSACSSTPQTPAPVVSPMGGDTRSSGGANAITTPVIPSTTATTNNDNQNGDLGGMVGLVAERSIYFGLDQYTVEPKYQAMLEAHAANIKAKSNLKILIQGSTDERGSREYNLALGQKRADAVKRALSILGVTEAQLESVSLGEEKPMNPGHDEAAWSENRRADIVYQTK